MITLAVVIGIAAVFGFVVAFGAPYVPSLGKEVRDAFDTLYRVTPGDVVIDLGSGDGKVLAEAVRRGASGHGYELNPVLVLVSRLRLRGKATVRLANMWNVDLPDTTTLVYVFSVTRDSKKLTRYVQAQATRQGRMIRIMTFGAPLTGLTPVATQRGHTLYEVAPTPAMQPETLTV